MSRLPTPGSDSDIWGDILNDYLNVSHDTDGSLKPAAVGGAIPDGSIGTTKLATGAVTDTKIADGTISEAKLDAATQAKLDAAGSGDPVVGGDLSGTASNAQIVAGAVTNTEISATANIAKSKLAPLNITDSDVSAISESKVTNLTTDLAGKQPVNSDLTTIAGLTPTNDDVLQRKAGAWANRTPAQLKTDLALSSADVGLGNVDNTSDASKPVSTATQTVLDAKTDKATLTTKGDIYTATAASTPTRLGVGADGEVLTADSTQPTGLKWASSGVSGTYIQGDGIAKVTVGTTAPTGPAVGDVWIQTP